jgi:multidrug efflux pump subunit AcrB
VRLEFFEPSAVPGFGAAGGFSVRMLDRTNTMNYLALGEVTEKFIDALKKRPELKGIFTFFASNYPQYDIQVNNAVAMQKGVTIFDALDTLSTLVAIEGGKLRFRPILMTSFAFIAGLVPLIRASGPGAIGNRTIGTAAVGGMLLGTVIGVLVIPGLYYLFARLAGDGKLLPDETNQPLSEALEQPSQPSHHEWSNDYE